MPIDIIFATIRAGFEFGTELLRFYQTPQGREALERAWSDRAKFENFVKDLFSGKLFA